MNEVINYYDSLSSYKDEVNESTIFWLDVELQAGGKIRSSTMPIVFLPVVIATIETADAARTALAVWNREDHRLALIPQHNIQRISIVLGK